MSSTQRYQRPGWFTSHVFNPAVARLTRLGLSVAGSRILEVRGRKTGEPRQTPVNLLTLDGTRYLVAPRGHTQWVRNLRVQGEGRLLLGRRAELFTACELSDDEKPPILRIYLERWKWEVGAFFDGVGPGAADDELRRIAPDHPIFLISMTASYAPLDMPVATQVPPTQPPLTPDDAWLALFAWAVMRSLHKEPPHRFADAVEFIAALKGARA
jgi:deazaflavin-dependent oxidoreductase (nitroreductase family)